MKGKAFTKRICFYFSCWSKKGYSIFAGLGHEVRISRLAVHMYGVVMLKSAPHGLIVNTDAASVICVAVPFRCGVRPVAVRTRGEVCPDAFDRIGLW